MYLNLQLFDVSLRPEVLFNKMKIDYTTKEPTKVTNYTLQQKLSSGFDPTHLE